MSSPCEAALGPTWFRPATRRTVVVRCPVAFDSTISIGCCKTLNSTHMSGKKERKGFEGQSRSENKGSTALYPMRNGEGDDVSRVFLQFPGTHFMPRLSLDFGMICITVETLTTGSLRLLVLPHLLVLGSLLCTHPQHRFHSSELQVEQKIKQSQHVPLAGVPFATSISIIKLLRVNRSGCRPTAS